MDQKESQFGPQTDFDKTQFQFDTSNSPSFRPASTNETMNFSPNDSYASSFESSGSSYSSSADYPAYETSYQNTYDNSQVPFQGAGVEFSGNMTFQQNQMYQPIDQSYQYGNQEYMIPQQNMQPNNNGYIPPQQVYVPPVPPYQQPVVAQYGNQQPKKKSKGLIIGLMSGFVALLAIVLLISFFPKEEEKGTSSARSRKRQTASVEEETEESESISSKHYWANCYVASDGSTIYFFKDGTFSWYQDEENSDAVKKGTYTLYFGEEAKQVLTTDLRQYGVTADEIDQMYVNSKKGDLVSLENLTVMILNTDSIYKDGKELACDPFTTPYYGHSNTLIYDSVNMNSANYSTFYPKY